MNNAKMFRTNSTFTIKKTMLRTCLKSRFEFYFISENSYKNQRDLNLTHNLFQTFRFVVYIFVFQIKYSRYVICFLNMRFTLYLIFIVTNDVNFTFVIANDQRIKKNKIVQFVTIAHFQHEFFDQFRDDRTFSTRIFQSTMTMTKSFSRFQHNRFFALNFAKLNDIRSNFVFVNCSSKYANN